MSKILCLDLGDVWVGSALSDSLHIVAQPYKTIQFSELDEELQNIIGKENINRIVIGYPQTLRGTISKQTEKVLAEKERLEKKFPQIKWVLWDERFSSKQAEKLKRAKTKAEKIISHSIAAALILENYLQFLSINKEIH